MSNTAIKPTAQRATHRASPVGDNRAVERASGTVLPNFRIVEGPTGTAMIADASRPAPEFRNLIKRLAHPPLFRKRDSEAYKAAQTRIADIFGNGNGIEIDEHGDGFARKAVTK